MLSGFTMDNSLSIIHSFTTFYWLVLLDLKPIWNKPETDHSLQDQQPL